MSSEQLELVRRLAVIGCQQVVYTTEVEAAMEAVYRHLLHLDLTLQAIARQVADEERRELTRIGSVSGNSLVARGICAKCHSGMTVQVRSGYAWARCDTPGCYGWGKLPEGA